MVETTTLENLKTELINIKNSVVAKENERSQKDVTVSYDTVLNNFKPCVKKIVIDFENKKTKATIYRVEVNKILRNLTGLSSNDFMSLLVFIEENELYQAYNLFTTDLLSDNKEVIIAQ